MQSKASLFFALCAGLWCLVAAGAVYAAGESSPTNGPKASSDASDSVEPTSTYSSTDTSTNTSTGEAYDDGWEYDSYYIFPLTRHMSDSELPLAGQIVLYPIGFAIDLIQWPFGALAGLGGK